jgi:hypothetical protein
MTRRAFVMSSNGPTGHEFTDYEPLRYALRDAERMCDCLSQPASDFQVTVPEPGTAAWGVREQLVFLAESCNTEDTFVCYFSGHGWVFKGSLMLLWDNSQPDKLLSTTIPISQVLESLKCCVARNKLLILDCCHAGIVSKTLGLKGNNSSAKPHVDSLTSADNYVILLASDHFEQTRELDIYEGSFLTANICAALTDSFHLADIDKDSKLSVLDLIGWLSDQAMKHNKLHPDLEVPIPYIVGQRKGEIILANREPDCSLTGRLAEAKSPYQRRALILELGLRDAEISPAEIEERVDTLLKYIADGDSVALRITAIEAICAVCGHYSASVKDVLEQLSQEAVEGSLQQAAVTALRILHREMVYIPEGICIIPGAEQVHCAAFYTDKYPVTNREYQEFVTSTGYVPDGILGRTKFEATREEHPVTGVTLADATAYARWAKMRLPTETEWLRAAYGELELGYPWGNKFDSAKCNTRELGTWSTTPVDRFPKGQSPFGVFDLAGNVWEWIHSSDTRTGIARGGSWKHAAQYASRKGRMTPNVLTSNDHLGFRCVRDVVVVLST